MSTNVLEASTLKSNESTGELAMYARVKITAIYGNVRVPNGRPEKEMNEAIKLMT